MLNVWKWTGRHTKFWGVIHRTPGFVVVVPYQTVMPHFLDQARVSSVPPTALQHYPALEAEP